MKLTKKLFILLLVICQMSYSINPITVKAEEATVSNEYNPNGSGVVWSEKCVEGWELEWVSCSFFDTLLSAEKEDTHIQYKYNDNGARYFKQVNDTIIYYEYDEKNNLISETTQGVRIEYTYSFSEEDYSYYMSGFVYKGIEYSYIFDNGIITGISCDGEQIVKYEYFNDIYEAALGLDENNNWVDKTSCEEFVGNINPIRFTGCYYDKETGWYYSGRYYSAGSGRFVDGVSPNYADELKQEYPEYEVMAKTYTSGINISSTLGRSTAITEGQAIARVIYLESSIYEDDQTCVAWVIKNRMTSSEFEPTTAFGVISQTIDGEKQVTAYESTDYNNFSDNADSELWVHANYLTYCLLSGSMPEKVSGYSDQLYFSSVNSFLNFTSADSSYFYYSGMRVSNCFFIPLGRNIMLSDLSSVSWSSYSGKYNVFCTKEWNY